MSNHRLNCNARVIVRTAGNARTIGSCISEMKTVLNSERVFKIMKLRQEPKKSILRRIKHKRAVYRQKMQEMQERQPAQFELLQRKRSEKRRSRSS